MTDPDITGPPHCTWEGCDYTACVSSLARAHEIREHLEAEPDGEAAVRA